MAWTTENILPVKCTAKKQSYSAIPFRPERFTASTRYKGLHTCLKLPGTVSSQAMSTQRNKGMVVTSSRYMY